MTLGNSHLVAQDLGKAWVTVLLTFHRILNPCLPPNIIIYLAPTQVRKSQSHSGQPCETLWESWGCFGMVFPFLPGPLILHLFCRQIYLYAITGTRFFLFLWDSKANAGVENPQACFLCSHVSAALSGKPQTSCRCQWIRHRFSLSRVFTKILTWAMA